MDFTRPQVRITADGSPTLICPRTGETYHSVNGAVAESLHVFIEAGLLTVGKKEVSVLEAGFGSGLNAWLTARTAERSFLRIDYTAVELFPVDPAAVAADPFPADGLFRELHNAPWGRKVTVGERFNLHKIWGDLAETVFDTKFDVVYYDMFAPDTTPGVWTAGVFSQIASAMDPGGILVTYCAKGDVKRALRAAGFDVKRLPGAPGKRHMLRAVRL